MPQAEIVKTRIIDVVPLRRVEREPEPQAITTSFAWTTQPVTIVEEVELPASLDPRLTLLRDPDSAQARGYRLLQHRLLASDSPRVITVTSARPGEGKTQVAANLALALSEESLSRVLLVEANLSRPGIADLFGFDPSDSFMTKLLRSEEAAPPHTVASIAGIRLQLAAVHPDIARGKRIDRALLAEALQNLRQSFDYIVFDAAAVTESADVNSVCACSDVAVIAARAGKSRKAELAEAAQKLSPTRVAGLVLLDT